MFISETAKAIVWLLRNDKDGWTVGICSLAHAETGIGLWTGNGFWFCNPFYNVPKDEAKRSGHVLSGREVHVSLIDKFYIWRNIWKNKAKANKHVFTEKIAGFAEKKFDQMSAGNQ